MTLHLCPIRGCKVRLPRAKLMCLDHWRRCPSSLQRTVLRAWNNGTPDADYPNVRQAAIDATQALVDEGAQT